MVILIVDDNAAKPLLDKASRIVYELGFETGYGPETLTPLAGGVSSDIAVVGAGDQRLCIKSALPELRVAERWAAPVRRAAAEYAWLDFVSGCFPEAVPRLYGFADQACGFAMAYLPPVRYRNWKAELLAGRIEKEPAAAVAEYLVAIHARSARPGFDARAFDNAADFRALRLDPYLGFTSTRHPELAGRLEHLSLACEANARVLIHGDVSPKNILVGPDGPVFLDAECATMGDAAFDVAFCVNHFMLKAVHMPQHADKLAALAHAFWQAYAAGVDWEPVDVLEARVARLLPALYLARVDGKSPVDYLSRAQRERVRSIALALLERDPADLSIVIENIKDSAHRA